MITICGQRLVAQPALHRLLAQEHLLSFSVYDQMYTQNIRGGPTIDQYFVHSRMFQEWGLNRLYQPIDHAMQDETGHVSRLIGRILFPGAFQRSGLKIGKTVPEMLANDLGLEYAMADGLRDTIATCEQARDYQTRGLFEDMLRDIEEDHAHWLEKQLGLIEKIGLQNYLEAQM